MKAVSAPRLPADLQAADLDEVFADDADLVGLTLSGSSIGARVRGVSLEESLVSTARLAAARIDRIRAIDVSFSGCDLSGALFVEPMLRRVRFHDCRLSGAAFELAKLHDVQFVECRMDTVGFSMAEMEATHFAGSDLTEASFRGARLEGCSILHSRLARADLGGLRSAGLDLHGSDLSDLSNPQGLAGARIDDAQLVPLALQMLAAAGIEVTDDEGPVATV